MHLKHLFAATLAVLTAPALADEVNVYSYRQPELIEPLFDAFTIATGIEVNTVFLNKGMVERLKAEGKRSPADLAFTSDIGRLAALQAAGVLDQVKSDYLVAQIPAEYRDPDGTWFGLTTRARVIYASKSRVGAGEITSYEDLANPKWRGRICTRSGLHAYMVALTAGMIEHAGEEAATDWLKGLKANLARKPQGNDRAQVKAIWAGECDISIGNTYYMAAMQRDPEQKVWADAVRIEFPVFEGGGTHVNVSGMALTKASPNREHAIRLMEYLASPDGQKLYAQINDEYPVNPDVPALGQVAAFGSFRPDTVNLQRLASLRGRAIALTELVDYDG
jgi:iron(III) transport system substrate-binding protein